MNKYSQEHQQIAAALLFLASSLGEKIAMLSDLPKTAEYYDEDGTIISLRTTELYLRSCAIIFGRDTWVAKGELHQLLVELDCVIQMALALGESVIDYHYVIDKTESPVVGPFDTVWSIIARLASEALRIGGASFNADSIDNRYLLRCSGLRLVDANI